MHVDLRKPFCDLIEAVLKPPGYMLSKLRYDGPLSKFEFSINLRRYIEASIVVTVAGATSVTKYVQIMPQPVHTALSAAGMYVDMIESPRYPGQGG